MFGCCQSLVILLCLTISVTSDSFDATHEDLVLIEPPKIQNHEGSEVEDISGEYGASQPKNTRKVNISKEELLKALFKLKDRKWEKVPTSDERAEDFTPKRTFDSSESNEDLCETPASIHEIQRTNQTRTGKNGKVYMITKVVKSRKCRREGRAKGEEIQRRTFSLIPNLSSLLPIPWLTKKPEESVERQYKGVNEPRKRGQGKIQTDYEAPHNVSADSYSSNKFKSVLNLFTIVKFDNGECSFSGLKGVCLHQIECQARGGKAIGSCAKGYGICCYVERTCGEQTRENFTYFVNEGFPRPSTVAPKVCSLIVQKAHPEVEQLRLEFIAFELRGPSNGTCISDRFTITGHNTNHVVPDICGINNEQHVYVDVDESNGPFNLNIITMGEDFPRTFQIKVTQIRKGDNLLAPKNCLQYYTEPSGIVQTFNYQYNDLGNLPQAVPGYFNNLNYAICLKKQVGFCSISYENEERESEDDSPTFQLMNTDQDGEKLLPPNQGGAEVFDCPDDYIIVNGIRLCGERLNDASVDVDYTKNSPVTEFSNGPFILQVRTNNVVSGRGFYLKYRQNPCMQ